ncbi:hypothetical protein WJX84_010117 [Apatococcus fuscideae]|uniref:Rhodanese domain-containing protein n=1 Tax=Apatococcus fuscideae TaxID=2026836 RepID=A0AAW1T0C0_9CHLO
MAPCSFATASAQLAAALPLEQQLRPQPWRRAQRPRRLPACCPVAASPSPINRGASGLDVDGFRPTSPKAWSIVTKALNQGKVKLISPSEAKLQADRGIPVIDIRPPPEFESSHIPDSVNIPLYRPITGWDARKIARRAGFAFFGVFNGTEANPDFTSDIQATLDASRSKGAVLVCNIGGSLEATQQNALGRQSRSLMAAYELLTLGFSNVNVLEGGMGAWSKSGRPTEP